MITEIYFTIGLILTFIGIIICEIKSSDSFTDYREDWFYFLLVLGFCVVSWPLILFFGGAVGIGKFIKKFL